MDDGITNDETKVRPKHVATVGRWRVVWRFGRYRSGWHRYSHGGHFTAALPFVWVSAVRRNKRLVPAERGEQ